MVRSVRNFAHVTRASLSWRVYICDLIRSWIIKLKMQTKRILKSKLWDRKHFVNWILGPWRKAYDLIELIVLLNQNRADRILPPSALTWESPGNCIAIIIT